MIIDDMLINLQTFRGFLQNVYELSMLTSVGQALLQLKRQPEPDLVILDMDMPEMNGIDASAKIRDLIGNTVLVLFVIDSYDKVLSRAAAKPAQQDISCVLYKAHLCEIGNQAHSFRAKNYGIEMQ